ncbi:MAG: hypothetical protein ACTSR8_13860 [Promethearchaeota archaeon]
MPSITFKILGVPSDRGERQILVDSELTLAEVKTLVKQDFKLVPSATITFLHSGKRYGRDVDDIQFKRIPIDPRKETITLIVSNPYSRT